MDDEFLHDLFSSVGPITIKRMFGGQGIYADGMIIAAVQSGRIMVKGDDQCAPAYESAEMIRWAYENPKSGNATLMPYWQVPDSALDDPEEMSRWAHMALGAARRTKPTKI
ncbi:MAG: TfoX/Sxy family protein [Pseudomonadota bacterium]